MPKTEYHALNEILRFLFQVTRRLQQKKITSQYHTSERHKTMTYKRNISVIKDKKNGKAGSILLQG